MKLARLATAASTRRWWPTTCGLSATRGRPPADRIAIARAQLGLPHTEATGTTLEPSDH